MQFNSINTVTSKYCLPYRNQYSSILVLLSRVKRPYQWPNEFDPLPIPKCIKMNSSKILPTQNFAGMLMQYLTFKITTKPKRNPFLMYTKKNVFHVYLTDRPTLPTITWRNHIGYIRKKTAGYIRQQSRRATCK